jgi:DNA-binding NarL/FixJ family response regulator
MEKILIVDDHPLIIEAIKCVLSKAFNKFCFISAHTVTEARQLTHSLVKNNLGGVKLALVDLQLPDGEGIDLIQELKCMQDTSVIAISGHADQLTVNACVKNGARGFIQKSSQLNSYATAVNIVLSGGQFFPESYFNPSANPMRSNVSRLTVRQRQVLDLLISGRTNKMIAKSLCLAEGTVRNHISDLFALFEVGSRSQLTFKAMQNGYRRLLEN